MDGGDLNIFTDNSGTRILIFYYYVLKLFFLVSWKPLDWTSVSSFLNWILTSGGFGKYVLNCY